MFQRRQRNEIDQLRQQLLDYDPQVRIRLGNLPPGALDDVTLIRIAVIGPAGRGKTCFINTCERVVLSKNRGSAPTVSTNNDGTFVLEDYLHDIRHVRLVDTRGQVNYDDIETWEIRKILEGVIRDGQEIDRDTAHPEPEVGDIAFSRRVHGAIFVVSSAELHGLEGTLRRFIEETLHKQGTFPFVSLGPFPRYVAGVV